VINDNIQSTPAIINVSIGGPIMTIITNKLMAEPLNFGAVWSVITPVNPKISTIMSEGTRLIRPVRKIYFQIEILLSNSRESSRGCLFSSIVVSCSGSKFYLHKCSENYSISLKKAIIKLNFMAELKANVHAGVNYNPLICRL
jgi:hypothetical protein